MKALAVITVVLILVLAWTQNRTIQKSSATSPADQTLVESGGPEQGQKEPTVTASRAQVTNQARNQQRTNQQGNIDKPQGLAHEYDNIEHTPYRTASRSYLKAAGSRGPGDYNKPAHQKATNQPSADPAPVYRK